VTHYSMLMASLPPSLRASASMDSGERENGLLEIKKADVFSGTGSRGRAKRREEAKKGRQVSALS
jgi:hypothetical protein